MNLERHTVAIDVIGLTPAGPVNLPPVQVDVWILVHDDGSRTRLDPLTTCACPRHLSLN